MAMTPTIPEYLLIPMLKLWQQGYNDTQLSEWLLEKHNISASTRVVNKRIKKIRDIELQSKRDAIARQAADTATELNYTAIINKKILLLDKITNDIYNSGNKTEMFLAKQLSETQLKYMDAQNNLMGMNKSDILDTDIDLIEEQINTKLGNNK